jgi:hypothetical protein
MMDLWITLPHFWKLQDVQATLNVIIAVLSGLGILVMTRCCWQLGARAFIHRRSVAASNLLTLSTLGEAAENLLLLRLDILRHGKLLFQCFGVIAFTLMTLLSGPIARYSTRPTTAIISSDINGTLVTKDFNSMANAQVEWNLTQSRLDEAGFPKDQLLDFMPDTSHSWMYRPEEWNNSWTMTCEYADETPIHNMFVSTDDCSDFQVKFGRETIQEMIPQWQSSEYSWWSSAEYYINATFYQDLLIFAYATNHTNFENVSNTDTTVDFAMAALHIHGFPKNSSDAPDTCAYGPGPANSASFTRAACHLTRAPLTAIQDYKAIAYPDCGDIDALPSAFAANYDPSFRKQAIAGQKIDLVKPEELVRFYQTYMVTKDTQDCHRVVRTLSIRVPAVQVTLTFVAVFAVLLLCIVIGGGQYLMFWLGRRKILGSLPQSKLDWLLHSMSMVRDDEKLDCVGPKRSDGVNADVRHPMERQLFLEEARYSTSSRSRDSPFYSPEECNQISKPLVPGSLDYTSQRDRQCKDASTRCDEVENMVFARDFR